MPGTCCCRRAATWALTWSAAANAPQLATKATAAAAQKRTSGKRMEKLAQPLDLARLEDAMAAIGRHDRFGVAAHGVLDEIFQRLASELAHARALEARAD